MSYDECDLKVCHRCKQEKPSSEFTKCKSNKDGLDNLCRTCKKIVNDSLKEYKKKHYIDNRTLYIERSRKYNEEHKEEIKKRKDEHRDENLIRYKKYNDEHKEQRKQYKLEHREHIREYNKQYNKQYKERRKVWLFNHKDRLKFKLRVIRCVSASLRGKYEDLTKLGIDFYTVDELRAHLESLFTPEMNWDNYGSYWELDHIIPQNCFNLESPESKDFKICWSLANLRPLEKYKNRCRPKDGSDVSEDVKIKILMQEGVK